MTTEEATDEASEETAQDLGLPKLPGAACAETANPDVFFSFHDWETEQARNICRRCPVIRECLTWALTHREHGLWAGTTDEQRTELLDRHSRSTP